MTAGPPAEAGSGPGGAQPDDGYFDVMAEHAEQHWWYVGRRCLATQLLTGRMKGGGRALDVGCGTGDALDTLSSAGADAVGGTDLSSYVLARARERHPDAGLVVSLAEQLPVRANAVDLLTSMDVVEHLDDDVVAMAEFRRVLAPDGCILLTVPAYQWLWSEHDEWAGHRRRYTKRRLTVVVQEAGFEVVQATYFNSFLVPAAALLRRTPLRRLSSSTDEEVSAIPVLDRLFAALAWLERRVVRWFPLPFGLSIALVACRSEDQA